MTTSSIEWTDVTWNPVRGCSKVSAGCVNCYAMKQAHRFSRPGGAYEGLTRIVKGKGPQWTGRIRLVPEKLDEPLGWRQPRRVFVNSMSDLFHPDVPFDFVDRVFAVMALTPRHTFQILTKRPERMAEYLADKTTRTFVWGFNASVLWDRVLHRPGSPQDPGWPLPNVWLGTSVEDQAAADERIPHLLRVPAAVRFLSCEPLLGPVELSLALGWRSARGVLSADPDVRKSGALRHSGLHWCIIGGESGPRARPMDLSWARDLVAQCLAAGVAPFVKQLGSRPTDPWADTGALIHDREPLPVKLADRKGGSIEEWPADLRIREFPTTAAGAAR